jgi:hypothetical protein
MWNGATFAIGADRECRDMDPDNSHPDHYGEGIPRAVSISK